MNSTGSGRNTMKIISDFMVFNKYASHLENEGRRQTWDETVGELEAMHMKKFPSLEDEIAKAFKFVYDKQVLPSMRSLQFGGFPIELNNSRIYNCCYNPADHPFYFPEIGFLLLSGNGVGYSVRKIHTSKLPIVKMPQGEIRFMVGDSIEGWADSYKMLLYSYFKGKPLPKFDYRDIRPKGSPIRKTGSIAPGPKRMAESHMKINEVLKRAVGRQLTPLEILDISNYIGTAIVSGGVRDAAMISLCDKNETDVITCKGIFKVHSAFVSSENKDGWLVKYKFVENQVMNTATYTDPDNNGYFSVFLTNKFGDYDLKQMLNHGQMPWYYVHPQRGKSNNSVHMRRYDTTREEFNNVMRMCEDSKAGEPAVYWCDDDDSGTNPCFTKDTKILTPSGYRTFGELWENGGKQEYLRGKTTNENAIATYGFIDIINSKGVVKATNVYRTSQSAVTSTINLSNGSSLQATSHHQFIVIDSEGNQTKKQLRDLEVGDKLPLSKETAYFGTYHNPKYAELAGWVIGDGTLTKSKNQYKATVCCFNEDTKDVLPLMREYALDVYEENNQSTNQKPKYNGTNQPLKHFNHKNLRFGSIVLGRMLHEDGLDIGQGGKHRVPKSLWNGDEQTIAGFLRGLFSADGSVQINDKRDAISIRLWQKSLPLLKEVKLLLTQFGIKSSIRVARTARKIMMNDGKGGKKLYNSSVQHELIITSNSGCKIFDEKIGFIQKTKNRKLKLALAQYFKGTITNGTIPYVKIRSIITSGIEEVFCLTEPENNEICVEGILVGNCVETWLRRNQYCNLTTQNVFNIKSQEQLNEQSRVAAFIGTLQASYTDLHYLRPIWRSQTEEDALLGVSMTGIASGKVLKYDLREAANVVLSENERIAKKIGINLAARTTALKPEGTGTWVAEVLGNGVHAIHSEYLLRNFRLKKTSPAYDFFKNNIPSQFIHDEFNNEADGAVISIPVYSNTNGTAIFRNEPMANFLGRVKKFATEWVAPGHRNGINMHNVSATVSVKNDEWQELSDWMWDNRNIYNGLSCLPYSDHNYHQAPFQEITKQEFEDMIKDFPEQLDFSKIHEERSNISFTTDAACAGGACLV